MPFDEDIALEIDALRSVYDDRELYINQTPSLEVEFIANPHIALGNEKSFVQATLHFRIPDGYPSIPPKIEIPSTRGLGEERKQRLLKSLSENAAEFCGDTSILTLCETARDLLDDINLPEGNCAICLESLMPSTECLDDVVLCPCYHSFHKWCFLEWWNAGQLDLKMEEQERIQKNGTGCLKMPLPKKHNGSYVLHCPICRAEVTNEDEAVLDALRDCPHLDASPWQGTGNECLDEILTPQELGYVRRFQERWQMPFRSQMQRGAFFPDSPFVLSLSAHTEASPTENEEFR